MAGIVIGVDALFEEFVAGWSKAESPDLDALLNRAGPDREELASLIDVFLTRAPRGEPTPAALQAVGALSARLAQEPPLLSARVSARKRLQEVVDAIVAFCDLPASAGQFVRSYYQRLEGGLLDPNGVSNRVWTAIEQAVSPAAKKLAFDGFTPVLPAPAQGGMLFKRAASEDRAAPAAPASFAAASALIPGAGAAAPDEIERRVEALFTAGERV